MNEFAISLTEAEVKKFEGYSRKVKNPYRMPYSLINIAIEKALLTKVDYEDLARQEEEKRNGTAEYLTWEEFMKEYDED
ncbi:MAG: hypothetical protein LBE35_08125 [Clostridiales bacterium]|jgi:hypothetical protein|nr:hypothetical protein [Clostridiales bacterium]